jgi:two-component system response regulator MprA
MSKGIVLIVDDDAAVREIMFEILTYEGYEVQTARNGLEGLCRLRRGGPLPDVIVLDVTMPVMDGVTFRRTQLRDPTLSRIPVVVASAVAPVHALLGTRQLQKPFGLSELLVAIAEELTDPWSACAAG